MRKTNEKTKDVLDRISKDRKRTNILQKPEQAAIAWLVQRVPSYVTSDALTYLGLFGNIIVAISFVLAAYFNISFLLISIVGFIVNWLGDSLDGRLAYYRNKPRKWYGFSLDVTIDWVGIMFIGIGFMIYVNSPFQILGFIFVVLYGWEMITALLKYKIINKYSIDSGIMGPTEVRIVVAIIIIIEVIIPTSIIYSTVLINILLIITNITDTRQLLRYADFKDIDENIKKEILDTIKTIGTQSK